MNKVEAFDLLWNHLPHWKRSDLDEAEHNKIIKKLEEYYKFA